MLHGIPFCALLGLRGGDMGLEFCCHLVFVLFFAFIFLVFTLCVTVMLFLSFSLVWFWHLFICMRFWVGLLIKD